MLSSSLAKRIAERASAASVAASPETVAKLEVYLRLLAKWNRKINLTAFVLDPPGDAALDRLLIEPLIAAAEVGPGPLRGLDIGSGGGSPALPLRLAIPTLAMTLVESRTRKAAFLREAVRVLGLGDVTIEGTRLEEHIKEIDTEWSYDLVFSRAVAVDQILLDHVLQLLKVTIYLTKHAGSAMILPWQPQSPRPSSRPSSSLSIPPIATSS